MHVERRPRHTQRYSTTQPHRDRTNHSPLDFLEVAGVPSGSRASCALPPGRAQSLKIHPWIFALPNRSRRDFASPPARSCKKPADRCIGQRASGGGGSRTRSQAVQPCSNLFYFAPKCILYNDLCQPCCSPMFRHGDAQLAT